VLIAIVQRAAQEIRAMDCIARIGGEEFAILLLETEDTSAYIIAERLRRALNDPAYPGLTSPASGVPVAVSVSIGLATCNGQETVSELLNRADRALYQAKAEGRNRVVPAASMAA
jgi:diguanylate cyclase (GGDEF)-like protein